MLDAVSDKRGRVDVIVPARMDHAVLFDQVKLCARAITHIEQRTVTVVLLLGRLLWVIQENPSFYRNRGYRSLKDFALNELCEKLGMGKTKLYDSLDIAKKWHKMRQEDLAAVGISKLRVLSKFTDQDAPSVHKFLREAKKRTYLELKEWAAEQGLIEAGGDHKELITIRASGAIAQEWGEFSTHEKVHIECESDDPGQILKALMAEFRGTYGISEED